MAISQQDFWKLLVQSKLYSEEQCRQLIAKFSKEAEQQDSSAKATAEWLVRQKRISKHQAAILLAGRPGPFVFGAYKIFDRLEGGRLNKFFRAVHNATKHPVLLKLLSGSVTEDAALWQAMLARFPATDHPHVTRSLDAIDQGKNKFLVMQELQGEALADVLKSSERIGADEACRVIRAAALGLSRLHDEEIVHGDIRPSNLWLDQDKNVRVFIEPDIGTRVFNLASAADEADGLIRADYAAPEFTQAGRLPDPLTDVYALGCTFYELVSGKPPFAGGDANQKLQRHATEPIQPLDELGVPPPLAQRIAYMMAKNPAVRYQSAKIVADQLAPFVPATQQSIRPAASRPTSAAFESWLKEKADTAATEADTSQRASASSAPVAPVVATDSRVAARQHPVVPLASAAAASNPDSSTLPEIAVKRRVKTRRKGNHIPLIASLVLFVIVIGLGIFIWQNPSLWSRAQPVAQKPVPGSPGEPSSLPGASVEKPSVSSTSPVTSVDQSATAANGAANRRATAIAKQDVTATIIDDDGQSLWASPTGGAAIDLKYVPPGVQFLFYARPVDVMASPEGQRVVKALGPEFESARASWESAAGVKLDEIEQLLIACYPNEGEYPRAAFVVRLKSDAEPNQLAAKWDGATALDGHPGVYQKGPLAYYVPSDDKRAFVMGPFDPLLKDAESTKWQAPLIRRELGQLIRASDADRHVAVIFTPNFLLGDSRALFSGDRGRALPGLEWLLGDDLQAGMLSLHFTDQFFFELRMESNIQIDQQKLASQFRERLSQIPESTELYVANLTPQPYWRLIANRYPGMVRFLYQQSRTGVEGNHAIVNAVLPGVAAHNLVFGGEMLLASAPGAAVASTGTPATAAGPKTIDDLLKSKISISFAQDSLEFAMQNVANEVASAFPALGFEFKIKIIGTDLEKDGITRNQQVRDFKQNDTSVADVLTAMVRKANPVTTVKDPSEIDQKLVWVVGPDPDNAANKIVLVTTRTAANQKKIELPQVFRPK